MEDPRRLLAARVAGAAQLLDVRLCDSSATLTDFGATDRLTFTADTELSAEQSPGSEAIVVQHRVAVTVTGADEQDQPTDHMVASITCTHEALYVVPTDIEADPDELDAFAQTTGVLTLWPYARALVQDLTQRMGLPALTLGVVRIGIDAPAAEVTDD